MIKPCSRVKAVLPCDGKASVQFEQGTVICIARRVLVELVMFVDMVAMVLEKTAIVGCAIGRRFERCRIYEKVKLYPGSSRQNIINFVT
jgi:hypothetical protein